MQPYLFPYLGYFQLIDAVDKFVICDDVQYIKGGWINRNNLLVNNNQHLFTFSVEQGKQDKAINERYYCIKAFNTELQKFYSILIRTYKKAPHFDEVFQLINKTFEYTDLNVGEFNSNTIKGICNYIGIDTELIKSSKIKKDSCLKRECKVIEINKILKATDYLNAIGGTKLYCKDTFEKSNIKLSFIKTLDVEYRQFNNEFIPNLSIIDVLMFNSKNEVKRLLNQYELV